MGEPPFLNNHEDFFKDTQAISIWARHRGDSDTANLLVELIRQVLLFNGLNENEYTLAPLAPRPSAYELEDFCSKAKAAVSSLQTGRHFFPSMLKTQTQPEEQAAPAPDVEGAREPESGGECSHSADYTICKWYGREFQFNKNQAACVGFLWEEWEKGTLTIKEETIGDALFSSAKKFRLDHVFMDKQLKRHPAWGTMIQRAGKGIFKLAKPSK